MRIATAPVRTAIGRPNALTPTSRRWGNGENVARAVCDGCGCGYLDYVKRLKKAKRHFCSAGCYRRHRHGSGNSNYRARDLRMTCAQCGAPFINKSYDADAKHCSRKCSSESKRRVLSIDEACALLTEMQETGCKLRVIAARLGTSDEHLRKMLKAHYPGWYSAVMERRNLQWSAVYRKGREFEYAVRRDLMRRGFVAMLSPRSEGPADILAVRSGTILLVQCKLYGALRKQERRRLREIAEISGGLPVLATGTCTAVEYFDVSALRRAIRIEEIECAS